VIEARRFALAFHHKKFNTLCLHSSRNSKRNALTGPKLRAVTHALRMNQPKRRVGLAAALACGVGREAHVARPA
jgi:hypothetical protein